MNRVSGLTVGQDGTIEGDGWDDILQTLCNDTFILPEEQPNASEGKYVLKVKNQESDKPDELVEVVFINDDGTPIWNNLPSSLQFQLMRFS